MFSFFLLHFLAVNLTVSHIQKLQKTVTILSKVNNESMFTFHREHEGREEKNFMRFKFLVIIT